MSKIIQLHAALTPIAIKHAVRKIKAVPPLLVAPELVLTANEKRLIAAYRKVDDESQEFTLCAAECLVADFSRRVAFRLVAGGAA